MINIPLKTFFKFAYLLLTICFAFSLFMCGDADCLTGKSNEECVSLLCSLLNKHDLPSHGPFDVNAKDCSCVCHMPIVIASAFELNYPPISQDNSSKAILPVTSAPNRLVYHPPAAA